MEKVDWCDIQGLVLSGYPELKYSAYVLWRFLPGPTVAAKVWLRDLSKRLMRCEAQDAEDLGSAAPRNIRAMKKRRGSELSAINLALSVHGLDHLGITRRERAHFSTEFLEGMAPRPERHVQPRRSNLLGDIGANSPNLWNWGGWGPNSGIDGLLLLYAPTPAVLDCLVDAETQAMWGAAEPIMATAPLATDALDLRGRIYCDGKEHFGFKDGISQPIIDGTAAAKKLKRYKPKEARISVVMPGEIVLGYLNERRSRAAFSSSAAVAAGSAAEPVTTRDLGRNGSYLVFRQLEQDVEAFNDFVAQTAARVQGKCDAEAKEWVASRLIGRRTSGEPLIELAEGGPSGASCRNDFLYQFEDPFGLSCPIGAHIRRANPRDTIGPDPDTALRLSKMHRILRRGRPYGERPRADAQGRAQQDKDKRRGMLFICLNADIAGQFELIQRSWLNNAHFGGLYAGADPLSHFQCGGVVTVQRRPTNLHLEVPKPFVTVRGGAYFFMPGITALRSLVQ